MIARLARVEDREAWEQFAQVYQPFLYRYARRRGLSDDQAQDTVQRIMMSVMGAVADWRPVAGGPKFRVWLYTIARNHVIKYWRSSQRNQISSGGTTAMQILNQVPQREGETDEQAEYRHQMVLFAASRIRKQIEPQTWSAFWKTAVEGIDCQQVAAELGMSISSVYAARSRVIGRIRSQLELMSEVSDEMP
jgi:RNA polymerase sigma-70 factor (ECF subfamily)